MNSGGNLSEEEFQSARSSIRSDMQSAATAQKPTLVEYDDSEESDNEKDEETPEVIATLLVQPLHSIWNGEPWTAPTIDLEPPHPSKKHHVPSVHEQKSTTKVDSRAGIPTVKESESSPPVDSKHGVTKNQKEVLEDLNPGVHFSST